MTGYISITRRLIITVLVLELSSAIALIAAIAVHERHVQLEAFDSSLTATAQALLGAVQDAEDEGDNVMLDIRQVQLAKRAIFRVEDDRGKVLGSQGELPSLERDSSELTSFMNADVDRRAYRFIVLHGMRIVDAGTPTGGTRHGITIIYGTPVGHVWHEVFEASRFYAIATAILLGITAVVMVWLVRKGLVPVHDLAREAERISSSDWRFDAPSSAKSTEELRPLAVALEAALARLRLSFEQQRRFTNDAAHELKTDLAIIKSSLQLLSMRKRTVEEYSRGLALGLDDFTRLESTVQKMLTLARLEQPANGDSDIKTTQFSSLRDAIEDAANQIGPTALLKAVKIKMAIDADVNVAIDKHDMALLCSNILLNAVQHSPEGSTIQITTVFKDEGIQLTVKDEGEGISDNDRDSVFEPFYRADPSRSRRSGGTGLGLSICRAICERAGGTIEIKNAPSGGALVTVKLPGESLPISPSLSASLKAE